ncbi:MAG: T9SS type A sorting domain-containing protein [Bacteroidota bacterium]|nr:T9SS type A sorting domain-containing protein [Bacteroidota bacterium]
MENDATMIIRGNDLRIWMQGGSLNIRYETTAGVVTGSSVYALAPSVNRVRYNIGFAYDEISGVGNMYVDDQTVWSNDGPNNTPLKFDKNTPVRIGTEMDGNGIANVGVLYKFEAYPYAIGVLPVELLYFRGLAKENTNILEWATASEINFDFFTLEKSFDLVQWNALGVVKGAGNSNSIINYRFEDDLSRNGIAYYRLKATDYDGCIEYHKVIRIKPIPKYIPFSVYPNPSDGKSLMLQMDDSGLEQGDLEVINIQGDKVYSKKFNLNTQIEFENKLKPGIYLVLVHQGLSTYKTRIQVR